MLPFERSLIDAEDLLGFADAVCVAQKLGCQQAARSFLKDDFHPTELMALKSRHHVVLRNLHFGDDDIPTVSHVPLRSK